MPSRRLAAATPATTGSRRTGIFHRESTRLRSNVADQVQRDLLPAGRMLSVFLIICELLAEVVVLVWSRHQSCDRPLRFWVQVLIILQAGTVILNCLNIWYGRDSLGIHRNGLSATDIDMYTDAPSAHVARGSNPVTLDNSAGAHSPDNSPSPNADDFERVAAAAAAVAAAAAASSTATSSTVAPTSSSSSSVAALPPTALRAGLHRALGRDGGADADADRSLAARQGVDAGARARDANIVVDVSRAQGGSAERDASPDIYDELDTQPLLYARFQDGGRDGGEMGGDGGGVGIDGEDGRRRGGDGGDRRDGHSGYARGGMRGAHEFARVGGFADGGTDSYDVSPAASGTIGGGVLSGVASVGGGGGAGLGSSMGGGGSGFASTEFVDRYVRIVNAWYLVWFILGSVWVSDSKMCSTTAPHLYRLVVALTIIYYALLFLPLACFCLIVCCLPLFILVYRIMLPYAERERRRARAADPAQVQSLNSIVYSPEAFRAHSGSENVDDASCVICLCDYEQDEIVRFLPCKHHFHKDCVDVWLRLDKACCLCKQDIDAVQPTSTPLTSSAV